MSAVWSSKSQPVQSENALKMGKQHFDFLAQPS